MWFTINLLYSRVASLFFFQFKIGSLSSDREISSAGTPCELDTERQTDFPGFYFSTFFNVDNFFSVVLMSFRYQSTLYYHNVRYYSTGTIVERTSAEAHCTCN